MPTIFVKDDLRASVEAATGGNCTVLYTATGQPSYMRIVPRFNLEDLDAALGTGPCPAFVVNGVEKSELFIGMYPGIRKNGELLSLPGVDPSVAMGHDGFVSHARANGPGWHLMTNAEWAAIALWCRANGFQPRGNTYYGRSSDAPYETGRRIDGLAPGLSSGSARTLTGSGPASWTHDNTIAGIADLCGNIWEWAPGMRIVDGEIQILPDNDAAASSADLSETSTAWRAIDGDTGDFVDPGHANAVKYGTTGTDGYTLVRASGQSFEGMTNPGTPAVSSAALTTLQRYLLYPMGSDQHGGDGFWLNTEGERVPIRGGSWLSIGAGAGVSALSVATSRGGTGTSLGGRPAFAA